MPYTNFSEEDEEHWDNPFVIDKLTQRMPGGFFVYRADEEEKILYANDILLEMFGCKNLDEFKDLTGYSFKGIVHPDDLDRVEKSIQEQIAGDDRNVDYVEYRIIRKDGSIRWVDDYGRLVTTKQYGDVFYVFIRDITAQHDAREENIRRAKVIEGLSIGFGSIYLVDFDKGTMRPYKLMNNYFEDIVESLNLDKKNAPFETVVAEYAKRHVIKKDQSFFLQENSLERILKRIQDEENYTFHYRCHDEKDRTIHMEVLIVRTQTKSLKHHVIMCYRDITEHVMSVRKELTEKLNIEMALEREKHANEVKAAFLFSMSHDIRTPMNAIMGFTALAQRHINEPELLKEYLTKLDESNHHMLELIDDLLEMGKIDFGQTEIQNTACDLRRQLQIVTDMFKIQAEEKAIHIETEINLPEQEVYVDSLRFRRIMSNLISNAVKFTPNDGTIKITARQKSVSNSGYGRYEFSVVDNGVGMSEDFMKKMFDAFERESTSTQTGYHGTGLGLTITKKLLNIMGGSISVQSNKNEGSTFTVSLPLKIVQTNEEEELPPTPREVKAQGTYRILLVEDIDVNRMLAETILSESGFLVESVADGCDAVEAIKNHPANYYDLVLMDIQMPVMNGYEATRAIRALGRKDTNVLPIIALSANAREQDKKMSMESGMDSHVAKPFDIAHLISTVNDHIAKD
ncbi:MAG: response regulator [Selenomonadaceae bacterium]|nr:response regulator [Selenomonadaceae bacterium]